jgi:hypothetical protein
MSVVIVISYVECRSSSSCLSFAQVAQPKLLLRPEQCALQIVPVFQILPAACVT